jgi:uncharacterized protein YegP (UPF0339 family)
VTNVTQLTVYQGDDGQWYWRATANNNEIVAQGEGFTRKDDAERAAESVFPDIDVREEAGE